MRKYSGVASTIQPDSSMVARPSLLAGRGDPPRRTSPLHTEVQPLDVLRASRPRGYCANTTSTRSLYPTILGDTNELRPTGRVL